MAAAAQGQGGRAQCPVHRAGRHRLRPGAELSRHDPDVQEWKTLPAGEKKLYARVMEVFAGFLTHTDFHYGRLFGFLKSIGEWDNTLIAFISDNGASSEGEPSGSVNESKFVPQQRAGPW